MSDSIQKKIMLFNCLISALFIYIGFYIEIFTIIAFVFNIISCIILKPKYTIVNIIFLLPWAYVYKISSFSISLYNVYCIFATIIFVFKSRIISKNIMIPIVLFSIYGLIPLTSTNALFQLAKICMGLFLLLYMVNYYDSNLKNEIIILFSISIILTSLIAIFTKDLSVISNRIDIDKDLVDFTYARFKGLMNDPNYYSINVILALFGLVYLFKSKKLPIYFIVLIPILILFGFLTYSKSFLVLLIIIVFYSIISSLKTRNIISMTLLVVTVSFIIVSISGRVEFINIILSRFNDSSGGVSSGRTELYSMYLNFIFNDWKVFLFGASLNNILLNNAAAHNSFIDLIFYFGIFGAGLYILIIYNIFNTKKNVMNFDGFIAAVLFIGAYFVLSGIINIDIVIHMFLTWIFLYNGKEGNKIGVNNEIFKF